MNSQLRICYILSTVPATEETEENQKDKYLWNGFFVPEEEIENKSKLDILSEVTKK